MNFLSYEESDPDADGDVTITLTIISQDTNLLHRVRKAFRIIVDDSSPDLRIMTPPKPTAS